MNPVKIVDVGTKEVKKIYHVSDVHIRNFKRHEEYRRVFSRLKDYIEKDNEPNSVILITGDIVHSKTDVSPELIQEVTYLFKLLSSVRHTIITAGNHDTNLKNSDRLDALSPVVEAINSDRVHYLKDGGVYQIANFFLCVWSVFDQPKDYLRAKDFEGSFKIATYHGSVNNALAYGEYKLNHAKVSVEDFEGYDLVLLGDIHKFQYLNEEKTIAYPGSFIQQDHSEDTHHGILVWNLKDKSSEFVEIENDTCYFTLQVDSGLCDTSQIPTDVNRLYLRIKHCNTSPAEIKKIVAEVKQRYEVVEVSNQLQRHRPGGSVDISNKANFVDTRDVNFQNKVISEYLNKKRNPSEKDMLDVLEINKRVNDSIKKPTEYRNSVWNLKRFEFDNMFSYGEGNYVDFSNMEGTYGLFAANASGKSSLLGAIEYCVFDRSSKATKGSQVMNSESDWFSCYLVFDMDDKEYYIKRVGSKQKTGSVKVDVDFYSIDGDGNKTSLNGKERNDTNNNIKSILGSHEDFVLTALAAQNGVASFIDMTQKDRKDLLSQFLDIGVFEELYTIANNEHRETLTMLKHHAKRNYEEEIVSHDASIVDYEDQIKENEKLKEEIEDRISESTESLLQLSSTIINLQDLNLDIDDLKSKKVSYEQALDKLRGSLEELKKSHELLLSKKAQQQLELDQCTSEEEIKAGLGALEGVQKRKEDVSVELAFFHSQMESKKEKLSKLTDLKYDPSCRYCMENIFVKDAIEVSSSFQENKQLFEQKQQLLNSVNQELSGSLIYKISYEKRLQVSKKLNETEKSISESSLQMLSLEGRIKEGGEKLKDVEHKISSYYDNESVIQKNKVVAENIERVKREIESLKIEQSKISSKISDAIANKKVSEREKKTCEELLNEVKKLETSSKVYELYLSAVHRDGVPHYIISNTLPKIESEVNDILSQFVEFRIAFTADDKNVNAHIAYDENRFWPVELASGMEKFVSSLAIRNALLSVSSLPRPSFMAIDEGFGVLSSDNLSSMPILFDYLKNQFKFVLMVSHIDVMRDFVDNHIEIHKINGRSKVQY